MVSTLLLRNWFPFLKCLSYLTNSPTSSASSSLSPAYSQISRISSWILFLWLKKTLLLSLIFPSLLPLTHLITFSNPLMNLYLLYLLMSRVFLTLSSPISSTISPTLLLALTTRHFSVIWYICYHILWYFPHSTHYVLVWFNHLFANFVNIWSILLELHQSSYTAIVLELNIFTCHIITYFII